jgi:hypothetical protein
MVCDYSLGLFSPFNLDSEKCPNAKEELVEISRFFVDISSNSPIVILLILIWYAKIITIDAIEILLYVHWQALRHANYEPSFSFASQEVNAFLNVQ